MRRNLSLIAGAVALELILFTPVVASQDAGRISKEKTAQIIARASDLVSLSLVGPVHIEADIRFATPRGTAKGTYTLDWASADRFRREIHLPGYDETTSVTGTTLFRKRSKNYTPLNAFRVEEMMDASSTIAQFQRDENRSLPTAPQGRDVPPTFGTGGPTAITVGKETCMPLTGNFFEQLCVDKNNDRPMEIYLRNTADDESIQYADYQSVGSGVVARERKYLDEGGVIAEAHIKHITKVMGFPPGTFVPVADAEQIEWCFDEIPAQLLPFKPPLPVTVDDFPNSEILDAFVHADGTPGRMAIIGTGGPSVDAAAQKLVNLIRFTPAKCGTKSVASEIPVVLSALDMGGIELAGPNGIPTAGEKGYTQPKCNYCPDPQYSDVGFKAKVQGTVILDVVVSPDGKAHYVRLLKGLGYGLDQEAIKSARDVWRFKPALGPDGKPAAVRMLIEIDFHLY